MYIYQPGILCIVYIYNIYTIYIYIYIRPRRSHSVGACRKRAPVILFECEHVLIIMFCILYT